MFSGLSFGNLSIRFKLILVYSGIFLFTIFVSDMFIWSSVRNTIEKHIECSLNNTTEMIRNMISAAVNTSIKNNLRAKAETNKKITEMMYQKYINGLITEDEAKKLMIEIFLNQPIGKTGYLYCMKSDGSLAFHPRKELIGVNLSQYGFVRKQMELKHGYLEYAWRHADEDEERPKALYMTYFEPWDWIISVSSYREEFFDIINVSDFSDKILSICIGNTGYSYVIDSKANVIIHPKLANTNLLEISDENTKKNIQEMCNKKSGKITYMWKNPDEDISREKIVIFRYLPEFDWIAASSAYKEEFYEPLKTIQYTIWMTAIITLILTVGFTLLVVSNMLRHLKKLLNSAQKLAQYDLTVSLDTNRKDEIGILMLAVKKMVKRLREIISASSNAAQRVSNYAVDISGDISEQAASATQQSATVAEISSTMEELSASSAQVADNSANVVNIANNALQKAQDGALSVESVMKKMDAINQNNQHHVQDIMALGKKSEEISQVMKIINNIADQTRLIAFNAALEASEAGEAGKRFSVVASEIRRLADNVTESTDEIENKIMEIQEASNHMVINSEQSSKEIQEGLKSFSQTVDLFNQILVGAGETTDSANQISLATQQQKTATDQVVIALRDIAHGAEQTSISIRHISSVCKELSTLSDELQKLMKKFILSNDGK